MYNSRAQVRTGLQNRKPSHTSKMDFIICQLYMLLQVIIGLGSIIITSKLN